MRRLHRCRQVRRGLGAVSVRLKIRKRAELLEECCKRLWVDAALHEMLVRIRVRLVCVPQVLLPGLLPEFPLLPILQTSSKIGRQASVQRAFAENP